MKKMVSVRNALDVISIAVGALLIAAGFNLFLIPHQLLSGGVSGISMLVGYLLGWNISFVYFVLNVPILIWGWIAIGRRFVVLSVTSVVLTTWFMQLVPLDHINEEPLLGAVFGGVLVGIGTGISFRAGGSSGGFDIIGSILTRNRDFPLGTALLILNGIVIFALGYVLNWDLALYSMLSLYVTSKVIDTIHIRHIKITAFIVTQQKEKMVERLLKLPRGVTLIKSEGAYSHLPHDMLMTVLTRYELAELRKIIREIDPKAFVNIVETAEVIGEFRRLQ